MSLHPIRSGRNTRRRKAAWRSFTTRNQWKPWKGWDTAPEKIRKSVLELFGKKTFVLLLIGLAISVGFVVMYADPKNQLFHSYVSGSTDPLTLIWHATSPASDLSEFTTYSPAGGAATWVNNCVGIGGTENCIRLTSPTSQTEVALTKQPVGDLAIANGKTLKVNITWAFGASFATQASFISFGYYLTTNGTIPTHDIGSTSAYTPLDDPNVVFADNLQCVATCNAGSGSHVGVQTAVYLLQKTGNRSDTLSSEKNGGCNISGAGSIFLCTNNAGTDFGGGGTVFPEASVQYFNLTGTTAPTACSSLGGTPVVLQGAGCSWVGIGTTSLPQAWTSTTIVPALQIQAQQLYLGLWVQSGMGNSILYTFDNGNAGAMNINSYVPAPTGTTPPNIDTGGFFGPIIKGLISIGVFILNSILGFIAFIAPALQSAITFLETLITNVLNLVGNALGWGNIGTDLATLTTALVTFLTDPTNGLPFWITQVPAYMSRFFNWITLGATWVPPSLTLAQNAINVALVGFTQAITILSVGLQFFAASSAFLMIFSYFLYVGDDALTGVLDWAGTIERLMFSLINIIFDVVNVSLDFIGMIVSVIPKPFIQMAFNRIPRLPSLNVGGGGVAWPRLDFAEALSGNLITYFFWIIGFYMSAWYESRNPCLVGSLCALIPSTASNMQLLATLLPVIQVFVFFSGGLCMFWLVNRPLTVIGLPEFLEEAGLGVGPGRAPRTSLAGVGVKAGVKHFGPKAFGVQARLEKASGRTSFKALGPFATGGHIEKGIGTKEAVSPGRLFEE